MTTAANTTEVGRGDSLADGAAGIALLHIEHSQHSATGTNSRDDWIAAIGQDPVNSRPDMASLFYGAPAVAFTLHATGDPRYAKTLSRLDQAIEGLTRQRLATAHARIDSAQPAENKEWDLISGLTGIAAQQLQRHPHGHLTKDLLRYLIRLSQPQLIDGGHRPGWWSPTGPDARLSPDWPGGHANLGIAHGIAGPLAVLAIATLHGVTVDGQREAIESIIAWLDRWRCGADSSAWWPGLISLSEWRDGIVWQTGPQRPSWCYGTPGIARAVQLAAIAVEDQRMQSAAEAALAGCAADIHQLKLLTDASLCHGWAGLVQVVRRALADALPGSPLAAALAQVTQRLSSHITTTKPLTRQGLLEGRAGVQLVEYASGKGLPRSGWDRCLLLA